MPSSQAPNRKGLVGSSPLLPELEADKTSLVPCATGKERGTDFYVILSTPVMGYIDLDLQLAPSLLSHLPVR